jgi:ligand-binding sensor domain-containing protein
VVLALAACARSAGAQSRLWRPEDRITITSFNNIVAMAYDGRRVFGVSTGGVEIYDELSRRWLEPSTLEDGFPVFARATSAVYDRAQAGLWLQTDAGMFFYSDLSQRWEQRPFDRGSVVTSTDPSRIPQNDPAWRIMSNTATVDSRGRRWPLTSVVPAERNGTYWAGTAGGNIFYADSRNLSSQFYMYGTLSRGVSALAVGPNGTLWFGGDAMGPRDGITSATHDLQNWTWYEPTTWRAPRGVTQFLLDGDAVFAAATDGVYVLRRGERSWRRIGEHEGLISDNARTLARTSFGIWVGTTHGLAVIDPVTLQVKWTGMSAAHVARLAARGEQVWAASDAGLFVAVADSSGVELRQPRAAETDASLRGRIDGVGMLGDTVAVIVRGRVYLLDENGGSNIVPDATMGAIGRAYDFRFDAGGLFVLGSNGVARRKVAGEWSYFAIPADIPDAPVNDVVSDGEYVWVATPSGATRLRWP